MNVEIYSDIVCPFCFIGKRQFEQALEKFEHKDEVTVMYSSFELNQDAAIDVEGDIYDMLTSKYSISRDQAIESNERVRQSGSQVGIEFHINEAHVTNSFNAHRLVKLASTQGKQNEALEALHSAYFEHGVHIGHVDELTKIGVLLGLDSSEVSTLFEGDQYSDEVRTDEARAREMGVTGVPFFVFDSKYGLSGAQGEENFLAILDQVWAEASL